MKRLHTIAPARARRYPDGAEDCAVITDDNEANEHGEETPVFGNQPASQRRKSGEGLTQIGTVKGNMAVLIVKDLCKDAAQYSIGGPIMESFVVDLGNHLSHQQNKQFHT